MSKKTQKYCFIMIQEHSIKKKTPVVETSRRSTFIYTVHVGPALLATFYTDGTHGHCPYSYTLSIVLVLAQLQGMLPEGRGGCSRCLATNLSGSSAGGNLAEMLGQPKHAASPVPGSHAGSCLKLSLQSVHPDIRVSLEGRL